ncbi:sugar phosphate nucleotidyltransferase [Cytophaga hutchinsonii]|jgi:glucose-1-phosphate thymidylyltransferase|uniref:Glucose-1-phosphate thymidyltransferase n=1 Tax=Cytophaga hutchinsonii (strain ATCC 33406 / DSM 1761 / CIP 103989 / NBRC 15051 / NCIMB 9469 / D465) TaxID=269798 RepID=A0A6N4SM34_CYTH3|nr:sugar phosphate nucleotidyltransferase [Cytophaga hutchinsonii]ABG57314.1 glucose-1-phosphate thymidyltransferase [Cytophaga hutchinsonii ATCC 33406]SFX46182.1 glucose-1-phosphate thymidylyltransferase [Cytophaga hutchinsonii ATCC 33406]
MKIIIPMAGMGKRMRPHTLTVPKPLVPIAGKAIVHRLVEDIAKVCGEKIEEVAFIIGDFGKETEKRLIKIAESVGAKGSIYYQREALGTAHAIYCAKESLGGKVVVAFADTLFKADFTLDTSNEGIIWVQKVEDPKPFGVVKLNDKNEITDFVEKPEHFVSDLAIIGIYYFQDGENLKKELQYVIDNDIKDKGEYQLTSALENMKNKGIKFLPGKVTDWLDCGNKDSTVDTNSRYLEYIKDQNLVAPTVKLVNSVIIQPSYVGENVELTNSIVGPYASIGNGTKITNTVINRSIVQENAVITNATISNSMFGNSAQYKGKALDLSVGDFNVIA